MARPKFWPLRFTIWVIEIVFSTLPMLIAGSLVGTKASLGETIKRGDWVICGVVLAAVAAGNAARVRPTSDDRTAICYAVFGFGVIEVALGASWFTVVFATTEHPTALWVYSALLWITAVLFSGVATYMTHVEDVVKGTYVDP